MSTKESKMIRLAEKNIFCSQIIPLNSTNNSVLIFLHDALGCSESWKEFPAQLCDKMETAGFLYDRLGHGKSDTLDMRWSKGYLEAEADFLRKIVLSQNFEKFNAQVLSCKVKKTSMPRKNIAAALPKKLETLGYPLLLKTAGIFRIKKTPVLYHKQSTTF